MKENLIYRKFIITEDQRYFLAEKDEIFKKLINVIGKIDNNYIPDPFIALVNSVIYQALSFKACTIIWNRFCNLVGELTPSNLLKISDIEIRNCGISISKIKYIKNIAEAFIKGKIDLNFDALSNKEIVKELTSIKGVGKWTAQMFLTFGLYRKDIISYSDLAIRRGIEWLYQMDHELTQIEFNELEKKFSPYNTIASLYLWEITLRKLFDFKTIYDVQ